MAKIAVGVSLIDKSKLIHWTMADFGERFLCHLTVTNFTKIDNQVLSYVYQLLENAKY